MSNSIYRLLMRWVYRTLYPLISPLLHPRQFGGQGTSPAHATQTFLQDLDQLDNIESILAFDVYHAFDSPPKALICQVPGRLGTPVRLLQLITQALEHGTTYIRGSQSTPFGTTHGVKEGCPLSCFLFVIVFDIPLRRLTAQGITFSAYVDDIAAPARAICSQKVADAVQEALSMIGCQINVIKSEALPLVRPPPPPPSLPQYLMPPLPVQTCGSSPWRTRPSPVPAEWANNRSHRFAGVSHLMHLGHPLPAFLDIKAAYRLIMHELRAQLQERHAHPIQTLDRILLVNTMVGPRLLYRTECLPLSNCQLSDINDCLQRFVLGVAGLPPLVARKTLHTHRRHGLGLAHFPTLHPTRVLGSLHRNYRLEEFSVRAKNPLAPYQQFGSAVNKLGPPCGDSPTPLPVVWQAQQTVRAAKEVVSVAGLQVYILPTTHAPEAVYTDGSKLGDPPSSGAAAVLRDGRVAVCRVPGAPNSYKAELVGILLGSHFSAEREKLCLDCQGAILSSQGSKPLLRQAHWVGQVRSSLQQKGQSLEWVEGHVGHQYNEMSHHYAKVGTLLPPPPPATRTSPWEVICQGEITPPPPQGMDTRPDPLPPTRTLPPGLVEASQATPPHMAQVAVWVAIQGGLQPLCHILARRALPCALHALWSQAQ